MGNQFEPGKWSDKKTGLEATLVKFDGETFWYSIAAFRGLCPITPELWLETMAPANLH